MSSTLGDALDLGGMQGIELPAPLALLLGAHLRSTAQGHDKGLLQGLVTLDLASDVADQTAQAGAQELQRPAVARFHCLAWA